MSLIDKAKEIIGLEPKKFGFGSFEFRGKILKEIDKNKIIFIDSKGNKKFAKISSAESLKSFKEVKGIKNNEKVIEEFNKELKRLKRHGFNLPNPKIMISESKENKNKEDFCIITNYIEGDNLDEVLRRNSYTENTKKKNILLENKVGIKGFFECIKSYLTETFEKKLSFFRDIFRPDQFLMDKNKLRGKRKIYLINFDPYFMIPDKTKNSKLDWGGLEGALSDLKDYNNDMLQEDIFDSKTYTHFKNWLVDINKKI